MSLYNMINGVQPATFFILPMLGRHPDEYPRFRDCFVGKEHSDEEVDQFGVPKHKHGEEMLISVYTRVGGGNRDDYESEIEQLRNMPGYVEDFDDDFDSTFATFVFKVPEKFESDFKLVKEGKIEEISDDLKNQIDKVYPKLKGKLPWHDKEAVESASEANVLSKPIDIEE